MYGFTSIPSSTGRGALIGNSFCKWRSCTLESSRGRKSELDTVCMAHPTKLVNRLQYRSSPNSNQASDVCATTCRCSLISLELTQKNRPSVVAVAVQHLLAASAHLAGQFCVSANRQTSAKHMQISSCLTPPMCPSSRVLFNKAKQLIHQHRHRTDHE
jgi:hypothetical protein